jgi:hypothetical protein
MNNTNPGAETPCLTTSLRSSAFITEEAFAAIVFEINEHFADVNSRIAELVAENDSLRDAVTQLQERAS